MEQSIQFLGLLCLLICLTSAATFLIPCEARVMRQLRNSPHAKSLKHPKGSHTKSVKHLGYSTSDPNNYYYNYMDSPNSLPPFEEVMGPSSSPLTNPPYCIYPPLTPFPPSTTQPTPSLPSQSPPPPPPTTTNPPVIIPNPPQYPTPSPPESIPSAPTYIPNPPEYVPSPPEYEPSPPSYGPSPPYYVPSPPEFVPGPPIFLPPVVYPPPTVPPPPSKGIGYELWCVAKPTVPDPIIQEAMNYACGSGADCNSIQPNGSCYQPDTLIAHASFAFNSYWQRTKVAGGSCDFGGTAMLVTKDPSYDRCHFTIA